MLYGQMSNLCHRIHIEHGYYNLRSKRYDWENQPAYAKALRAAEECVQFEWTYSHRTSSKVTYRPDLLRLGLPEIYLIRCEKANRRCRARLALWYRLKHDRHT